MSSVRSNFSGRAARFLWYFTRKSTGIACRIITSSLVVGLLLALYGLATHYVDAMRHHAPLRILGLFDLKAQVGNVVYAAILNAGEFGPHLIHGEWGAAMRNLTNMAGIRSDIYTQVFYAGATNNAESFLLVAPFVGAVLLLGRLLLMRRRLRLIAAHEKTTPTLGKVLAYFARIGLASAAFTTVLLNTIRAYQGVSGVAGWLGYVGSALAQVIDTTVAVGAGVLKEISWHVFFMLTDGKEKTLGLLSRNTPLEDTSHYLAHFPTDKIPDAFNTVAYQALIAGALLLLALQLQHRNATSESAPVPKRRVPSTRPKRQKRLNKRRPAKVKVSGKA